MKITTLSVTPGSHAASASYSLEDVLAPIYDAAHSSSSLIASRHTVRSATARHDIPRFLLLGQRGGGKPISVGLFGGLDANSEATVLGVSRVLLQFELNPLLAKDYALFGYPVVNMEGFGTTPTTRAEFEARFGAENPEEDVLFFRSELEQWNFDGHLVLSIDPAGEAFHAASRSRVLAEEVVTPALRSISPSLPVADQPTSLRPSDRHSRLADFQRGKLTSVVGTRPYPFEFEISAPASLDLEKQVTGLSLIVQEILWNYRKFISHGQGI